MPQGLQVWDASGNLLIDTSTKLGRILGITNTTIYNGSVTSADFAQGTPFWILTSLANYNASQPTLSYDSSTHTLSWTWGTSGASYNTDCKLIYGVY